MTHRQELVARSMIAAILLAVACHTKADAEEPKVVPASDVLTQMRQSLAKIVSVQYDFQYVVTRRDHDGKETTRTTDATFAWSDGKYYCLNQIDSEPPTFTQLAFDGELYQHMRQRSGRLMVHTEIPRLPYETLQPILLPYRFVPLGDGRLELEKIQSEESWKEIAAKATSGEPREIAGHACQVVKFSTTGGLGGEIHWEICAASDLDYFPIQQSNYHGEGDRRTDSTFSVMRFADLKTPRGCIIIPLEIEAVSLNAKREKIQTFTSKNYETSIKVNEPIANETFWLKRLRPIKTRFLGNVTDEQEQRYEKGPR